MRGQKGQMNDELVGLGDTEYRQMRAATSEEERWTTRFEVFCKLRNVKKKARRMEMQNKRKNTDLVLEEKLSKRIRCLNRWITPPRQSHVCILGEREEDCSSLRV